MSPADETTAQYWYDRSQVELDAALAESQGFNTNRAEGMILFIGDGMGVSTVTAARILKGQLAGNTGEESKLFYDGFPHLGYSKVRGTFAMGDFGYGVSSGPLLAHRK